jgi:hypothetical protein
MVYSDAKSLESLKNWFEEFKTRRPVEDHGDEVIKFCWVAVGTKIDVWQERKDQQEGHGIDETVPRDEDVQRMFEELLPLPRHRRLVNGKETVPREGYAIDRDQEGGGSPGGEADATVLPHPPHAPTVQSPLPHCDNPLEQVVDTMPKTIDVLPNHHGHRQSQSSRTTTSGYDTARTNTSSIYHTPSASLADSSASIRSDDTITPSGPVTPEYEAGSAEEYLSAELKSKAARGIDMYMATSPPRAPHSVSMMERLNQHAYQGGPALLRQGATRGQEGAAAGVDKGKSRQDGKETIKAEDDERPGNGAAHPERDDAADTAGHLEYDYSRDGIKTFKVSAKTGRGVDQV